MPSAISVLFCSRPNVGVETGAPDPRAASRVRPIRLRHLGRGLPPKELKRIDAEIDRLRQDRAQQHGQRKNILQLGLRSAITRALCADERLLTLIEGVVHPGSPSTRRRWSKNLPSMRPSAIGIRTMPTLNNSRSAPAECRFGFPCQTATKAMAVCGWSPAVISKACSPGPVAKTGSATSPFNMERSPSMGPCRYRSKRDRSCSFTP